MYISIEQAIDVYDDLFQAMNGTHGFGGNEAEIYVFRLLPSNPGYERGVESPLFGIDNKLSEKKAAEEFHTLCHIFATKHNSDIKINNLQYNDWISKIRIEEIRFHDRIIVRVEKNKQ